MNLTESQKWEVEEVVQPLVKEIQTKDKNYLDAAKNHNDQLSQSFTQYTPKPSGVFEQNPVVRSSRSRIDSDDPAEELKDRKGKLKEYTTPGKPDIGSLLLGRKQSISISGIKQTTRQEGFDDKLTNISNIDQLGEQFLEHFKIGFAWKKGLKPESPNQDDFCITLENNVLILGVFDGHGTYGHDVSDFVHTFLPTAILQNEKFREKPKNAIKKSFKMTQLGLVLECDSAHCPYDCMLSGTTATVAVIIDKILYMAYVGDSRAVMGQRIGDQIKHKPLTKDHKPQDEAERQRILDKGGQIRKDPGDVFQRIYQPGKGYPGINMSRSIGDLLAQTLGVIPTPDIQKIEIQENDEFILLWSDGVWEFIKNLEAVKMVEKFGRNNIEKAAQYLAEQAWERWIENEHDLVDDITVLIHYFN